MSLIKLNINKKFGREEKKEGGGETLSVKKKREKWYSSRDPSSLVFHRPFHYNSRVDLNTYSVGKRGIHGVDFIPFYSSKLGISRKKEISKPLFRIENYSDFKFNPRVYTRTFDILGNVSILRLSQSNDSTKRDKVKIKKSNKYDSPSRVQNR